MAAGWGTSGPWILVRRGCSCFRGLGVQLGSWRGVLWWGCRRGEVSCLAPYL